MDFTDKERDYLMKRYRKFNEHPLDTYDFKTNLDMCVKELGSNMHNFVEELETKNEEYS